MQKKSHSFSKKNSEKDSEYWDYWAEMVKASVLRETNELPAIAEAVELKGKHVIDLGCGPGRLIVPFSKLAATITVVDENNWAISAVNALLKEHRLKERVQIVQCPLVGLPFDDDSSEGSYAIWVIHHGKDRWKKIVAELVRVTKPNAPVVFGFSSSQKDLPALEDIIKKGHLAASREFDNVFPQWCRDQGWNVEIRRVPLAFEFTSPEWALEVFQHTFFPRTASQEEMNAALAKLKTLKRGKKVVVEQEMLLVIVRKKEGE